MPAVAVSGDIHVHVLEGSRIKNKAILGQPNVYVKIKNVKGEKARTRACVRTTAPRWTDAHENHLKLSTSNALVDDLRVEVWQESKNQPNKCIDALVMPLRPYLRVGGSSSKAGVPTWHALQSQGSLLFSLTFETDDITTTGETTEVDLDDLNSMITTTTQRATDPTTEHFYATQTYHNPEDTSNLVFGATLCLHALGGRFVTYGSSLRTCIQRTRKCLQLSPPNSEVSSFFLQGDEDAGVPVTYGTRFLLWTTTRNNKNKNIKEPEQRVQLGTGWFEAHPVHGSTKSLGDIVEYGDAMYLQAIVAKTGAHYLGAEGESHHVLDSTIYITPSVARVAFTLTYGDGLVKAPVLKPVASLNVKITTYNVWMMPDKITTFADVSPKKNGRF